MPYSIDPVKGTLANCGDCQVIDMSNKCYSICAAFNQGRDDQNLTPVFERGSNGIVPVPVAPLFPDAWNATDDCAKKCNVLMNKQKILQFGENSCDHQAPYRPVVWGEAPHFFPKLLRTLGDKDEALRTCNALCSREEIKLPEQCKINCLDEYNSVVGDGILDREGSGSNSTPSSSLPSWALPLIILGGCFLIIILFTKFSKTVNKK